MLYQDNNRVTLQNIRRQDIVKIIVQRELPRASQLARLEWNTSL